MDKIDSISKTMDDEDDELEALRQAALATMKTRTNSVLEHGMSSPITTKTDTSFPLVNNESRRTTQIGRARGRGRHFPPKGNQRSNLIVITPVNLYTEEKTAAQLQLPQNSWCHSLSDDTNIATYRKTGPTRFNRFESGSESSDSELDNSDNNSYSNDTILQDETSERLSCEDSCGTKDFVDDENVITSFQDDSSLSNSASFENEHSPSLRDSEPSAASVLSKSSEKTLQNDKNVNHDDASKSEIKHETKQAKTFSENILHKAESSASNGQLTPGENHLPVYPCGKESQPVSSVKHSSVSKDDQNNHPKDSSSSINKLGKNDLRLQLKKRMEGHKLTKSENAPDASKHRDHYRSEKSSNERNRRHRHNRRHSHSRSRSCSPQHHGSVSAKKDQPSRYSSEKQNITRGKYQERESKGQSDRLVSPSHEPKRRRSTDSSSGSDSLPLRPSVSSVVKPMFTTWKSDSSKGSVLLESDIEPRKVKNEELKESRFLPLQSSIQGGESINKGSEVSKRVPVHMRLGTLSKKRIIQRTKDVEAAFVNSSSDEDDLSVTCKKDSSRVVTEVHRSKSTHQLDRNFQKNSFDREKNKRMKVKR